MTTPKLQMPELVVGQAGKELTHNQALAVLDQLAQAVVVDKDLTAPPGSPANGSMYIVAAGATGAWAGQDGKLAYWLTTVAAWTFITPADGWSVWVADEAKRYERASGAWAIVSSGGGSGDMLSTLISSEVSIAGSVTLTASAFGKMHVCSGTSADYTVGLPAVSGNAGKLIGFRMSPALTKFVTIDGNASELIDGAVSRAMWKDEVAVLLCDGTAWTKIAGKSIPLSCGMYPTAAVSIPSATFTAVSLGGVITDNSGSMAETANYRMRIKRPGIYRVNAVIYFQPGASAMTVPQCVVDLNGVLGAIGSTTGWGTTTATEVRREIYIDDTFALAANDLITLSAKQTGGTRALYTNDITWTFLKMAEVITW